MAEAGRVSHVEAVTMGIRGLAMVARRASDALRPLPAIHRSTDRAVLRCCFQLNDGEMLVPGQVSDAQVEALVASPSDVSQRHGVEDSRAGALIPLLGKRNYGVGRSARHENLRDELSGETVPGCKISA